MFDEAIPQLILLFAITLWLALKHVIAAHRAETQRRIAQAGETSFGKVVAIQRPFMLDDCTRFYFDFVPAGSEKPVRACHVTRRVDDESPRPLPVQGAIVAIRYLPAHPTRAVIGKLVTG